MHINKSGCLHFTACLDDFGSIPENYSVYVNSGDQSFYVYHRGVKMPYTSNLGHLCPRGLCCLRELA